MRPEPEVDHASPKIAKLGGASIIYLFNLFHLIETWTQGSFAFNEDYGFMGRDAV